VAVTSLRIEIAPKSMFLALGIIAGVVLLGRLTLVLTVVTIALILVGTFDPVVAWLERRGLRRGRSLAVVFVIAALALAAVAFFMIPPLLSQFGDLLVHAPETRDQVLASLNEHRWAAPVAQAIAKIPMEGITARAGKLILGYSEDMLEVVGLGLSTLFLAIYLLAEPVRSKSLLFALVPRDHHVKLAKILIELRVIVGGYMRGQLITSAAISVFVFAVLKILGADNALAIALFAGITDIIPFVGGYIASTPVIVAAAPHGATIAIVVAGLMVLYQEFESRILVPRVYGKVLRLPPAIVLVALLVGGSLAGILGALLALPIAAGIQMITRELRVELPGEATEHDDERARDLRANEVYEHLADGVSPDNAVMIADEVATRVKDAEDRDDRFTEQIAAVAIVPQKS
jgi:putative heme transporter